MHCCLPPGNMKWFSKDSLFLIPALHSLSVCLRQSLRALIPSLFWVWLMGPGGAEWQLSGERHQRCSWCFFQFCLIKPSSLLAVARVHSGKLWCFKTCLLIYISSELCQKYLKWFKSFHHSLSGQSPTLSLASPSVAASSLFCFSTFWFLWFSYLFCYLPNPPFVFFCTKLRKRESELMLKLNL